MGYPVLKVPLDQRDPPDLKGQQVRPVRPERTVLMVPWVLPVQKGQPVLRVLPVLKARLDPQALKAKWVLPVPRETLARKDPRDPSLRTRGGSSTHVATVRSHVRSASTLTTCGSAKWSLTTGSTQTRGSTRRKEKQVAEVTLNREINSAQLSARLATVLGLPEPVPILGQDNEDGTWTYSTLPDAARPDVPEETLAVEANAQVDDPDFGRTPEEIRARAAWLSLEQYKNEAAAVFAAPTNPTAAQIKGLFDRFARVCALNQDLIKYLFRD